MLFPLFLFLATNTPLSLSLWCAGYLAQSITFGREEAIIMTLSPGAYTLSIKYFDAREPQFCDTFFLMIGIAPLSLVPSDLCSGAALPSVSLSRLHQHPH